MRKILFFLIFFVFSFLSVSASSSIDAQKAFDDAADKYVDEEKWDDNDIDWSKAKEAFLKAELDLKKAQEEESKKAKSIEMNMIPHSDTIHYAWEKTAWLDSVAAYIKNTIFWIFYTIAVWVFIYLWTKLLVARWNQEEFKKALVWFIYAAVWIAIVPLAWALVKLVSGIDF